MKVLCIIPCYNAKNTLKRAIESIINQSYTNWELIIVDDASTDKSYKMAQSYSKQYPNITVLRNNTNQGCYYSRNRALYHMKDKEWDVFTIHDADDISDLRRFQHFIDIFESDSSIVYLKSTSIKFKNKPYAFVFSCYLIYLLSLFTTGYFMNLNKYSLIFFILILIQMFYFQIKKLKIEEPTSCLKAFKSNNFLGLIVFLSLIIGKL